MLCAILGRNLTNEYGERFIVFVTFFYLLLSFRSNDIKKIVHEKLLCGERERERERMNERERDRTIYTLTMSRDTGALLMTMMTTEVTTLIMIMTTQYN